ncbi:MAG: transglutaminase domain-containing protein, partial [Candidatus Woesearchaeota archaeon]
KNTVNEFTVQALSNDFNYEKSDLSEGIIYNYTEYNIPEYTDNFFYFRSYNDYNIINNKQFLSALGYMFSNQKNELKLYIANYQNGGASAIDSEFLSDIRTDYYYKTSDAQARNSLNYIKNEDTITLKVNEYKTQLEPTESSPYPDIDDHKQLSEPEPFKSDTGTNDIFVDNAILEQEVESSYQLLNAVTSGAKPVFSKDNSNAEKIYNKAYNTLLDIIDDTMNDKEKVKAIHDWISYNTLYDYNLYESSEEQEQPDYGYAHEYNAFNLEGVFLDGYAVCDGIAKAFELMTSMIGIDNHTIIGETSAGNHAWNQVKIDLNNDGSKTWHTIDVTWDMPYKNNNGTKEEYLSHEYFLVSESKISDTHDPINFWE